MDAFLPLLGLWRFVVAGLPSIPLSPGQTSLLSGADTDLRVALAIFQDQFTLAAHHPFHLLDRPEVPQAVQSNVRDHEKTGVWARRRA